jgi:hypothetical protein
LSDTDHQRKKRENKKFLESKINKIDKPLTKLTKRKTIPKLIKLKMKKGAITMNTNKIQSIIREYFENLNSNKLKNLEEMHKFLTAFDYQN